MSRRFLRITLTSALLAAIELMAGRASAADDLPHVRTAEPHIQRLLKAGLLRSNTLRGLIAQLNDSDVVVYVRYDASLPPSLAGKTWFVTAAGGVRYLQMELMPSADALEVTTAMAHELAHALEVAEDPSIVDTASMTAHYLAAGAVRTRNDQIFVETTVALKTGAQARRELMPHQADLLFASTR